ncbi:MAG: hypothetical protein HY094_07525 [Candidatus Melainabacteria bacterium]|nr:hypothetical protein [Candidatus Melainabacteria bacterium]
MRIIYKAIAGLGLALGTVAANGHAFKAREQKDSTPAVKKTTLPKKEENIFIKTEDIKAAKEDLNSIFAYETFSNPACPLTEDLIKLARDNKNTLAAMAVAKRLPFSKHNEKTPIPMAAAKRLPADKTTKEDLDAIKAGRKEYFYLGLKQNENLKKLEPNLDWLAQSDLSKPIYNKKFPDVFEQTYEIRPIDIIRAQDFPNTIFAYRVAIDKKNPELEIKFSLGHPDSAFAIGTFRREDIKIVEYINWALKKENANTEVAYEIGRRLSVEQLTDEIKNKVRGELRDTKLAKAVAANEHFGLKSPYSYIKGIPLDDLGGQEVEILIDNSGALRISPDDEGSRKDIIHMFHHKDLFSEGLASNKTLKITAQMKYAAWHNEKFYKSNGAYYLAKSAEWIKGIHTYESERFIRKNYETPLAYGHVENPDYIAQVFMREFIKELALKDQESEFLLRVTNNPYYFKSLNQEQLEEEFKFALKNGGKYSEGIFKNLPSQFKQKIAQATLENPYRADLAKGFLARKDFELYSEFLDFVTGKSKEENINTPLAQVFVSSDYCIPSSQMLSKIGDPRFLLFERALRVNPYLNNLTARFDRKYIDQ